MTYFLKLILKPIIFWALVMSLFITSCQKDQEEVSFQETSKLVFDKDSSQPFVVYLLDKNDSISVSYNHQIRKTINYAKIPYQQFDVTTFNEEAQLPKTARVVVLTDVDKLSEKALKSLINYVSKGNTVFFPNATQSKNFGFFLGAKPNAAYNVNSKAHGFNFKTEFIPKLKNKSINYNFIHFGLERENFGETTQILAVAENDNSFPTIIKNNIGKGKAIAINTSNLAEKQDRGILFASILLGLDGIPYPIANVNSIFLDDFPAPLYNAKQEPVASEFNLSQRDFYTNVWWPDMIKLAKKHQLNYTAVPCFDYRGTTSPPFLFPEWDASVSEINSKKVNLSNQLVNSLITNNFELGFHGYNHESLVKKDWPSVDFMVLALKSANKRWNALNYGEMPTTYVPPSNLIDSLGISALHKGMPSIRTMSSTYFGDFNEGGNREFDTEPYLNSMFDFPRNTSGYVLQNKDAYLHQSVFLFTGIWSHFLHPDDVYQIPDESTKQSRGNFDYRNPESYGWRKSRNGSLGLLPRFENYISSTKQQFPLARFVTTEEAVNITKNWRKASYNYENKNGNYSVKSNNTNTLHYWFLYIKQNNLKNVTQTLNAKSIKYSKFKFLEGELLMIETKSSNFDVENIEIPVNVKLTDNEIVETDNDSIVQQDAYTKFLKNEPIFETIDEEINYAVENNQSKKAIVLLEQKISAQINPNLNDLKRLNTYYQWNNNSNEIWTFLEKLYQTTKSNNVITFSEKAITGSDYPDLETRKKWMLRQMTINPNNSKLKLAYNTYFTKENVSTISSDELIKLYNQSSTNKERLNVLNEFLESDNKEASVQFFNKIEPCKEKLYDELNDRLVWFYADNGNFIKALDWSKCSNNISEENISEWLIKTNRLEELKQLNYSKYIDYLLVENPNEAISLLSNETPCSIDNINTTGVSYVFADKGFYRKALAWSKCDKNFPFKDQLVWYAELGEYDELINLYKTYIEKKPIDYDEINAYVSEVFTGLSNNREAFKIADLIQDNSLRIASKPQLNSGLKYAELSDKKYIIKTYPDLVDTDLLAEINKELRINQGHYIDAESNLVADKLIATGFGNELTYNFHNNKGAKHSIGINNYNAYALNTNLGALANRNHYLYGLNYSYQLKKRNEKFNYSGKILLEQNTEGDVFYQLSLRANKAKDSLYSSFELSHKPAITGPAYSLNIYRTQLSIYEEYQFNKRFTGILALEANYFNDNKFYDGLLVGKFMTHFYIDSKNTLLPYTEIAGMLGNTNQLTGYPYWTIKERLYGGAGLSFNHLNKSTNLEYGLNVGGFLDTFSDEFLRYGGNLNYPINNYFKLRANAEFFTLKNFYNNNFTLGLTYYLK